MPDKDCCLSENEGKISGLAKLLVPREGHKVSELRTVLRDSRMGSGAQKQRPPAERSASVKGPSHEEDSS